MVCSDFTKDYKKLFEENKKNTRKLKLSKTREETRDEICSIIKTESINGGITQDKLAEKINLHRTNLTKYVKDLEERGQIQREEVNNKKFVKYTIKDDFFKNQIFRSKSVGYAFSKILEDYHLIILNDLSNQRENSFNVSYVYDDNEYTLDFPHEFNQYFELFKPLFDKKDEVEKILFEFSHRLGGLIMYLVIFVLFTTVNNDYLTSHQRMLLLNKMIKDGISTFSPYILSSFMRVLDLGSFVKVYPEDQKKRQDFIKKNSRYGSTKDAREKILAAFFRLYPYLTYLIEGKIDKENRKFNTLEYAKISPIWEILLKLQNEDKQLLEKQKKCDHIFKYFKPVSNKIHHKQCTKCLVLNRLKKSEITKLKKNHKTKEN